jgi:hypothetical protein
MANPVTHKANSVHFRSAHLNRSTILLSRLSSPCRLSPKGVTSLTLFPALPYHPPHAPKPNHPDYQLHGGRLGGLPR